jgi:hypothetical protein
MNPKDMDDENLKEKLKEIASTLENSSDYIIEAWERGISFPRPNRDWESVPA